MIVTIRGSVTDIDGKPDGSAWWFRPVLPRSGATEGVLSTHNAAVTPVAGNLTVELDPGIAIVGYEGRVWAITVPEQDADVWELIEAGVPLPPNTSQEQFGSTVGSHLQTYVGDSIGAHLTTDGLVQFVWLGQDVGDPVELAIPATTTAPATAAATTSFLVDAYGADPTGKLASDTAVATAIAALGTSPGVIEFGIGTYRLDSTKTLARAGQYFKGQGTGLTTIDARAAGPTLKCWDSTTDPTGNGSPGRGGGVLGGMLIDGTNNTRVNSIGLQLGDLVQAKVEHVRIVGFIRAGCIGFLGQNRYGWTEYGYFGIQSDYNATSFVLEAHPSHPLAYSGTTSWSYNTFDFGFSAEANQNGVIVRNHVVAIGVTWTMRFNCNPGPSNTGVAVTIGVGPEYNHIEAECFWSGETTNAGSVGHKDINLGSGSSLRGVGSLIFNDFSAQFVAGNAVPSKITFAGRVECPSLGHYARLEIPFATIGDPGRFGAQGDNANYVLIEESVLGYPVMRPKGPGVPGAHPPSSSVGIAIQSKLDEDDERRSLVTIDGVNVVDTFTSLGTNVADDGHYDDWTYFPLATLPPDSPTNASSLSISGRLGGCLNSDIGNWSILLTNRGDFSGGTITAMVVGNGELRSTDPIWNAVDIAIFQQVDTSAVVLLKLRYFHVYDMNVKMRQGTLDWAPDNAPVTPTGTLIWTLKESDKLSRTYVDAELTKLVTKETAQEISGSKTFVTDLHVGGGIVLAAGLAANSFKVQSGAITFGQPVYCGHQQLHSVGPPTSYFDAATKGYVDDKLPGTPRGPTASGVAGQMSYDSTHVYVCVAANTWLRATLATW